MNIKQTYQNCDDTEWTRWKKNTQKQQQQKIQGEIPCKITTANCSC